MSPALFLISALCGLLFGGVLCSNNIIDTLTLSTWYGSAAYVPVERDAVQAALDDFHLTRKGPRLYLPINPPFPDFLTCDQHVVYVDFGTVTSHGFEDYENDTRFDLSGPEFAVTIPLLGDSPHGLPKYSLTLAKFYQRDRADFPKVNIAFQYKSVDLLNLTNSGVVLRDGNDELRIKITESQTEPCNPPREVIVHEFEEFINQDLQLGAPQPHFQFCDRHRDVNNYFCTTVRRIDSEVNKYAPNVCQTFWKSDDQFICRASIEIETISEGFRSLLLLSSDRDDIHTISSMTFYGNYTIGLKYPCITDRRG